ncbi:nucleoside hydrolase [Colwellia sp. 1_MG-2023]|uniref:nucleoside hydrolase n=1 Tax=unclassified Colwellia TaxID=196834 RepID=UPI001C0A65CA|nr:MULTISPECIES: nucleoside hydrolase [unclassified Colwellia]MBU2926027.1 nucleoside hydrolase [Colwellia sp. C2M11]MDO6653168.1 nucleoside hydrolase [Colwellia sp. 3_MG-2023]MDO6666079.1 nucleoside hydrolase [Colwellia sp. 2_MG-2023]MDO6690435.1 nucleoside hydrolase [Colwellia sp. 1_MG-2023]
MRTLIFTLALCFTSVVFAKPVIFDNDMAIDDWAALLFLLQHPQADVVAITISSSGESHCSPGLTNTNSLLDLSKYSRDSVLVACGDDEPLDGYAVFPDAWRKDSDTLSGVAVKPSNRKASSEHAIEIIHQAIKEANEPVIIVATGTLTNIAQWIEKYPADMKEVSRLIIMGGNVDAPGNIIVPNFTDGHPNVSAEWNIFIDPLAADKVLASGLPIELVGLDVTNSVRLTAKVASEFKKSVTTPAAQFWDQILDKNDWFIESGEYYFWDTLAAIVAVEPELCEGEMGSFSVEHKATDTPWLPTSQLDFPKKRWDGQDRQHLDAQWAGKLIKSDKYPAIKVCKKTNPSKVFSLFSEVLNRQ